MSEHAEFNQILEQLRQLRQEKGLTLEQLASETKIKLTYFQDLEAGNLNKLPKVYDRFIFRTYLEKIGAENIDELLQRFDALTGRLPGESTIIRQYKALHEKPLISGFTVLKAIYFIIPLIIIIVLLVIFFKNYKPKSDVQKSSVKELTAMEIVQQTSKEEQESVLKEEEVSDSLVVVINSADYCWLKFVKDHADTGDVTIAPKNTFKVVADSVLEFVIGNPSVITMKVNDLYFENLADSGQVISYMKVSGEGIEKKRIVKPKKKVNRNETTQTP